MDSDDDIITIDENIRNHKYRWRSVESPTCSREFQGKEFGQPPDNFDQLMPYDVFIKFWSDYITELLVEQTNLFSVQITGKSICTNFDEIEQIFGIQMMMGIIKMPNYHYYWQSETRMPRIADTMSHNRYKNFYAYSINCTKGL